MDAALGGNGAVATAQAFPIIKTDGRLHFRAIYFRDLNTDPQCIMTELDRLTEILIRFRDERNWKQFHTLKNLIVSLNLEASELLELTQWKTDDALESLKSDEAFREDLKDECADVFLYLLQIADHAGIDLLKAAEEKIRKNAVRYPADRSYGSARKYSELDTEEQPELPEAERQVRGDS